jgi:hypothetical protein
LGIPGSCSARSVLRYIAVLLFCPGSVFTTAPVLLYSVRISNSRGLLRISSPTPDPGHCGPMIASTCNPFFPHPRRKQWNHSVL